MYVPGGKGGFKPPGSVGAGGGGGGGAEEECGGGKIYNNFGVLILMILMQLHSSLFYLLCLFIQICPTFKRYITLLQIK